MILISESNTLIDQWNKMRGKKVEGEKYSIKWDIWLFNCLEREKREEEWLKLLSFLVWLGRNYEREKNSIFVNDKNILK